MVLKWFTLLVLLKYLNSVILGGCFGAGNYGMCGRAYDPRMMYVASFNLFIAKNLFIYLFMY